MGGQLIPHPLGTEVGQDDISGLNKKRAYNFNNRRPTDPTLKKRKEGDSKRMKNTTKEFIIVATSVTCGCKKECCRFMPREAIREAHNDSYGLPTAERTGYILDLFRSREQAVVDAGQMLFQKVLVCKRAFWQLFSFSRGTFYSYEKQYLNGARTGFHGNTGTKKTWGHVMLGWGYLDSILRSFGEAMPHMPYLGGKGTSNICYKLPSCYAKEEIMVDVNKFLKSTGKSMISKTTFHRLWKNYYDNYSIHQKGSFAKCEKCTSLKERLQAERRPIQRKLLEDEREAHMVAQMSRRNLYYANRVQASR